MLFAIFKQGNNFSDFLFGSLGDKALQQWGRNVAANSSPKPLGLEQD